MNGIVALLIIIAIAAVTAWATLALKRHGVPFFNTVIQDNQSMIGREYIRKEAAAGVEIWNLDGRDWFECPIPPKSHSCWTQTRGTVPSKRNANNLSETMFVRRCACGAISINDYLDIDIYWSDRNSRKVPK